MVRALSTALALNRCAFGLGYLIAPSRTGSGWIASDAGRAPTQVMIRGLGARDLALGAGALRALLGGDASARAWMAAHALADSSDLVATLAARSSLPRRNLLFASVMAGASTAIAIAGAVSGET